MATLKMRGVYLFETRHPFLEGSSWRWLRPMKAKECNIVQTPEAELRATAAKRHFVRDL
jgi:hypothetical protein